MLLWTFSAFYALLWAGFTVALAFRAKFQSQPELPSRLTWAKSCPQLSDGAGSERSRLPAKLQRAKA
jgi:hypothetical protein